MLFPFVQYDYDNPSTNTLFAITNLSSKAQVVHVTLWTDWAFATVNFDVFLTGYDTVSFDLFQIIGLGKGVGHGLAHAAIDLRRGGAGR